VAVVAVTSLLGGAATRAHAHGGDLNAQGCHNERKGGMGYHCHRSGSGQLSARAAGAAPVCGGDAGYGTHLDRDGDGVGCE
jgi:hypothetical protein